MLSYLLLQSTQLILIPILILIVLTFLAIVLVLLRRRRLVQPQKDAREQLEATAQQLTKTQEQLEMIRKQFAAFESQLAEARRQQEETKSQLTETQEQLEDTRRQLTASKEQLEASQNQLRELELRGEAPKRENPLDNMAWIKLTQECVDLFDELDRKSVSMDPKRQEMAGYVCSQLEEILERCGVTIISDDSVFDESRHRPYPAISKITAGTAITETLSPGFVVGPRVLRRARVRVAEAGE